MTKKTLRQTYARSISSIKEIMKLILFSNTKGKYSVLKSKAADHNK